MPNHEPFLPMENLLDPGVWMFWVGTLLALLNATVWNTGDVLSAWFVAIHVGFILMGAFMLEQQVGRNLYGEQDVKHTELILFVGFGIFATSVYKIGSLMGFI